MTIGENENITHYMYIHNVFGNFYKSVLQYYSEYLYPRFTWTVMGTYDKAVEYITKQELLNGREGDQPQTTSLILNPSGEFTIADAITGAKQQWRFPNLAGGFVSRLFEPIYRDDDVTITPGFSRFMGDIELIMLCSSFYEYCDLRVYMMQIMGGFDRYIYPEYFDSFIIIPPEFYNYVYTNEITGVTHQIDWTKTNIENKLIETTNKNEWIIPVKIKPIFKLTSLSDSSTKYGGDQLADWKLSATISYEIEIPTFLCIETDMLLKGVEINLGFAGQFTKYPEVPFDPIFMGYDEKTGEKEYSKTKIIDNEQKVSITIASSKGTINLTDLDKNLESTTGIVKNPIPLPPMAPPEFRPIRLTDNNPPFDQNSAVPNNVIDNNSNRHISDLSEDIIQIKSTIDNTIDDDNQLIKPIIANIERKKPKKLKIRYVHIVTPGQAGSISNWEFFIPEVIDDTDLLILNSRHGKMSYDTHYKVITNGTKIQIIYDNVKLMENDLIELYVYKYEE
jgi:hypothetical protein